MTVTHTCGACETEISGPDLDGFADAFLARVRAHHDCRPPDADVLAVSCFVIAPRSLYDERGFEEVKQRRLDTVVRRTV